MEVAIKVSFIRKDTTEIRRFSGSFDWDGLTSVIAHLWGGNAPKSYSVEYVDEDGDNVRIGSDLEWKECVRLFVASKQPGALRLIVRRTKKDDKHCRPQSGAENEVSEEQVVVSGAEAVVPKLAIPTPQPEPTAAKQEQEPLRSPGAPDEQADLVFKLISILFGCDAKAELLNYHSHINFDSIARILRLNGEVDVDVNQDALRSVAICEGNRAMEDRNYQRAIDILSTASMIFDRNRVVRYNLACALSLNGDVDSAVASLGDAVALGYDNVEQITYDEDLNNIRSHPQFARILATLQPVAEVKEVASVVAVESPVPVVEVVVTPAKAEEKPAVVAVPVVVPEVVPEPPKPSLQYPREVETMQSIFPDLDATVADEILKTHRGNVRKAIDSMFV